MYSSCQLCKRLMIVDGIHGVVCLFCPDGKDTPYCIDCVKKYTPASQNYLSIECQRCKAKYEHEWGHPNKIILF